MDPNIPPQPVQNEIPATPQQPISKIPSSGTKGKIILFIIIFIIIIFGGVTYYLSVKQNKSLLQNTTLKSKIISSSPLLSSALTPVYIGNYDVEVKISSNSPCNTNIYLDSCKSDIYLKDKQSGKETYILTTDNVVAGDSRVPQYRAGYIFLIKRTGNDNYPSNDWTDELWVYTDNNHGQKIYDSKGLYFIPNDDGTLVALALYENNNPPRDSITLLSRANNWQPKKYPVDVKECVLNNNPASGFDPTELNLGIEKWQNPSVFWGSYNIETQVDCYWKLDAKTSSITYYSSTDYQKLFPEYFIPTPTPTPFISTYKFTDLIETPDTSTWKTYTSKMLGFEIKYPSEYLMDGSNDAPDNPGISTEYVNLITNNANVREELGIINFSNEKNSTQYDNLSFKDYAVAVLENNCAADGGNGGEYCDKAISVDSFTNLNGVTGYEIKLNLISHTNNPPSKTESTMGPFFVFEYPQENVMGARGVFITPHYETMKQVGFQDETLNQMLSTFKLIN